jgi:hypothetical protein
VLLLEMLKFSKNHFLKNKYFVKENEKSNCREFFKKKNFQNGKVLLGGISHESWRWPNNFYIVGTNRYIAQVYKEPHGWRPPTYNMKCLGCTLCTTSPARLPDTN